MSRSDYRHPEPRGEVRVSVDGGQKCPRGCGATLKTTLDVYLHGRCDDKATSTDASRGDRRTKSSAA